MANKAKGFLRILLIAAGVFLIILAVLFFSSNAPILEAQKDGNNVIATPYFYNNSKDGVIRIDSYKFVPLGEDYLISSSYVNAKSGEQATLKPMSKDVDFFVVYAEDNKELRFITLRSEKTLIKLH